MPLRRAAAGKIQHLSKSGTRNSQVSLSQLSRLFRSLVLCIHIVVHSIFVHLHKYDSYHHMMLLCSEKTLLLVNLFLAAPRPKVLKRKGARQSRFPWERQQ